jgi:hypothetical protein
MISPPDNIDGARMIWEFLWYSGIAGAMLVLIVLIVRGKLVPEVHHQWAIKNLSDDRDGWKTHSQEMSEAFKAISLAYDKLSEARGRR